MCDDIIPSLPIRPRQIARQPFTGSPKGFALAQEDSGKIFEVRSRRTHIALPQVLIEALWDDAVLIRPLLYKIDTADPMSHVTFADKQEFVLRDGSRTRFFRADIVHLKNYATVSARGAERQFRLDWKITCTGIQRPNQPLLPDDTERPTLH